MAATTQPVCTHCQREIQPQSQFCMFCGAPVFSDSVLLVVPRRTVRQKVGIGILTALALFIACGAVYIIFFDTPPPGLTYEWVQAQQTTFALDIGEGVLFGRIQPEAGLVKYDVESSSPINTGLPIQGSPGEELPTSSCYESKVLKTQKMCQVGNMDLRAIYIQDARGAQDALGALGGLAMGRGKLAEDALTKNRVTLTIYQRKCVTNCL
ncbi:MAG: zinc-ribbon domain-containing protein [Acidobacteriia bacterium]|nr:zinc-ribbon domain-containing protein [Terriglobia bacterium]